MYRNMPVIIFIQFYLHKNLQEHKTKIERALKKSFLILDEELGRFKNNENIGSTATVIFINRETDAMLGTKKSPILCEYRRYSMCSF